MVTVQDITSAVQRMGLSGLPLCVHASLRSFGWVDGGAATVVAGILQQGCTVVVPTFSWTFAVPPPDRLRRARNGWDYDKFRGPFPGVGRVYTPDSTEVDKDEMGVVSAYIAAMPQRLRGNHPLCSFSAVGPLSERLIAGQTPMHVWAPFEALADAGGAVVLMGVGLEKLTLLHLAEQMAGRNPFLRWANAPDGEAAEVQVGGCSDGFGNLLPVLSPLQTEHRVGESRWLVFPARATLEVASQAIREIPRLTHCSVAGCGRCNDALLGGPVMHEIGAEG